MVQSPGDLGPWHSHVEEESIEPERPIVDPHHHLWHDRGIFPQYLLEDLWATASKVTLETSRNKTIALVFRGVRDKRSARFVEAIDEFCASRPELQMLTISYLRGSANVVEELDRLRAELNSIGYQGAAGFDPDADGKSLIRSYKANVGSATFLVIDAEGKPAWFQQDPRTIDINLGKNILRRIAELD